MTKRGSEISAILLAAGESRRMGSFKQLLRIGEHTFVERCVETLAASSVDRVVVVTGYRAPDVEKVLQDQPVTFAYNQSYALGMSSSIARGVRALPASARACLIALVDQPLIPVSAIEELICAYETNRPLICLPSYKGRRGHPVLIDLSLRSELETIESTTGLKGVLTAHTEATLVVEVPTETILIDFDFPQDYETIMEKR